MSIRRKFIVIGSLIAMVIVAFVLIGAFTFRAAEVLAKKTQKGVQQHLLSLENMRRTDQAQLLVAKLERYGKERLDNRNSPSPDPRFKLQISHQQDSLQTLLRQLAQHHQDSVSLLCIQQLQALADSLATITGDALDQIVREYQQHHDNDDAERQRLQELLHITLSDAQKQLKQHQHQLSYALFRQLQLTLLELELNAHNLLDSPDAELIDVSRLQRFRAALATLRTLGERPDTRALRPAFQKVHRLLQDDLLQFVGTSSQRQSWQKRILLKAEFGLARITDSLHAHFALLSHQQHAELTHSSQKLQAALANLSLNLSNTYFLNFVLAAISLLTLGALLISLARGLVLPLLQASSMASRIAGGDYSARSNSTRTDEFGDLARSMDRMADHIAATTLILEKSNQELADKNQELEQFSYTVAHDLRSPLVTITGFLHEMEADIAAQDAEAIQSDLAFILKSTSHMSQLLDGILQLSRLGKACETGGTVALRTIIERMEEVMQGALKTFDAKLNYPSELPVIQGDPLRLQQVFQNLVENALKYRIPQVPCQINILYQNTPEGHLLQVQDNGIGIASDQLERIFGLFEKLDKQSSGIGFGLAMVKRIIELHEGRIWATSTGKNQGSTFHLLFPHTSKKAPPLGKRP